MELIRIIGWNKYQHYKNRNPPWIKLHQELLTSQTWVNCDDASRVLAIAIMLLAAKTDNKIPDDSKYLQRVAYLNKPPNLKPLLDVQFIEYIDRASNMLADASDLLATCASTEEETEKSRVEKETEKKGTRVRALKTPPPDSLEVTAEMGTFAEGLGVRNVAQETAAMLDHFRSKGESRADWPATWRNWMRNSLKFAPKNGNGNGVHHKPTDAEIEAVGARHRANLAPKGTR